jgi:hypothetical protein
MHGFRYARITLFRLLKWLGSAAGLIAGVAFGFRWFGVVGASFGAVVGFFGGMFLASLPEEFGYHLIMRGIERSSTPELRARLTEGSWNFFHTMALLQLAARGEDVQPDLPRVLGMLESDNVRERLFGQDALRLVYTELVEQSGYNAEEPTVTCREKISRLRNTLPLK